VTYQYRADYLGVAAPTEVASSAGKYAPTYGRAFKRAFDLLIVALAALPTLAVLLILGAIVALDGHSPLFIQDRVGRGGQVFRLFKLRTMVPNADAVLEQTLARDPAARAEWDKFQKLRHDPRITRIGRILRKTSLDELPQLINVALGDMSIVGPRPIMDSQRSIYPGTEYYQMRPGITGFWQVSVRNESSFSERAQFDRSYFKQMSFATDLRVIAKTFKVVLKGTGV
jgi:exopolysaccharide production protein ExoY